MRRRIVLGGLLLAAALGRLWPLAVSPLPFNVDGFALARSAEDVLATGRFDLAGSHDTSRPGATALLALASLVTRLPPLEIVQPLFSLVGLAAVVVTWLVLRRFAGLPREAEPFALAALALLGSFVYFSAATMKQATGFVLLPPALALLLLGRTRTQRIGGAALLLALPLFHHFVALLALTALLLALAAIAGARGWRQVPRDAAAALVIGGVWTVAFVHALREPIGSSWHLIVAGAWLFGAVIVLVALGVAALARRPRRPAAIGVALALAPLAGAAAVAVNAIVPVFEGGHRTGTLAAWAALPYGVALAIAAMGVGLVLGVRDERLRAFALGLLGAIVSVLLFAALRGLDAGSFYLAQRTVDFGVPLFALGYGLAGARLHARARRRGRAAGAAAAALLVALPALTLPIALADGPGWGYGHQILPDELAALAWVAANVEGNVSTDTRYGFVLEQYFERDAVQTLAFDLAQGARPNGTLVLARDWATHGGELKPQGVHRVDVAALEAACETLHETTRALVLRC